MGTEVPARALPATVSRVDDSTGAQVRRRRMAMGMSVKALAEHAGIDRGRLTVLEDGGNVRLTTVSAVLRALDELEQEMGMDYPAPTVSAVEPVPNSNGLLRIRVEGMYGAESLVVEGPVDNPEAVAAAVDAIMRKRRASDTPEP